MNEPVHDRGVSSRRRLAIGLIAVLAAGGVATAIVRWARSPPPPPIIDPAGIDPAVAAAVAEARGAVLRTPRSGAAWGRLGLVLVAHHIDPQARACFAQAEKLDPRNPRWPYLQAMLLSLEDSDQTIQKLERSTELCAGESELPRLRLGEALLAKGRLDGAEQEFQEVLRRDDAHARARLDMARVALQRDRLAEARQEVARSLHDTHTRKAAHLLLAEIEQRSNNRSAAADALQLATSLPDDEAWPDPFLEDLARLKTGTDAAMERALQLLAQGRNAEAAHELHRIVQSGAASHYAWLLLGKALGGLGHIAEAELAVRTALRMQGDSSEGHFQLGAIRFVQSDLDGATAAFHRAVELRPNFAEAHYMLGRCRLQAGDETGAIEEYRTAVQCRPDHAEALAALGELLVSQGEREEGLEKMRRAAALRPDDAGLRERLEPAEK
jgi:tetratricopeptide (TPR) repeat protein